MDGEHIDIVSIDNVPPKLREVMLIHRRARRLLDETLSTNRVAVWSSLVFAGVVGVVAVATSLTLFFIYGEQQIAVTILGAAAVHTTVTAYWSINSVQEVKLRMDDLRAAVEELGKYDVVLDNEHAPADLWIEHHDLEDEVRQELRRVRGDKRAAFAE